MPCGTTALFFENVHQLDNYMFSHGSSRSHLRYSSWGYGFTFSNKDGIVDVGVGLGFWGLFDTYFSGVLQVVADWGYDGWWSQAGGKDCCSLQLYRKHPSLNEGNPLDELVYIPHAKEYIGHQVVDDSEPNASA